jgi:hypothetical protein
MMSKTDAERVTSSRLWLPTGENLPTPTDDYELLRVLLIGSHRGVNSTIRTLFVLKFAQVGEWSPLLPAANSAEVMSILTRRIKQDRNS